MISRRDFFRGLLYAGALAASRLYAPAALQVVVAPRPDVYSVAFAGIVPLYLKLGLDHLRQRARLPRLISME